LTAQSQCDICKKWFDDSILDAHLLDHAGAQVERKGLPTLKCPLCGGVEFSRESGSFQGSWGQSRHKLVLAICQKCHLVLPFYEGRSIFGFAGNRNSNSEDIREVLNSRP